MQVSAVILVLAAAVMTARAESFTAEDQAIWIDRHNYFRTTGLPWSAGDMRRIGWSADLATSAATTAKKCSATSGAGVNVYQSSSANSSSLIDEAIQQWIVETSLTTLKTLAQPGASGVDVGTGTYNSYSQVLWASTTSVGCAAASCPSGALVVCEYSPPGNDASSPWYVHADTASDCPSGTTAKLGLCIVDGDVANNQIAPIPAGKLTYEVYPAYVADMQTVLIEAARALANGATTYSTGSTTDATTAPTETTATPTATTAPTSSSSETPSSGTKDDSYATKTGTKTSSSSSDSEDDSATKTGSTKKTTTSSSSDTSSSSSSDSPSPSTSSSSTDSSSESSTKQTSQTTDESAPGTVKAISDTGSTFTNQATQTTTGSSTEQTSGSTPAPASTPSTANTERSTASKSTSSADAASTINNKSGTEASGGISAAGLAGMIVLAIVGIAAFGVVMSYKRNQQRQREIMRDGGIRII